MIEKRTVFEIHRLAHEGLSVRKIATTLPLDHGRPVLGFRPFRAFSRFQIRHEPSPSAASLSRS